MEQDTMTSKFQKVNNAYLHYEVIQGRAELLLGKRYAPTLSAQGKF